AQPTTPELGGCNGTRGPRTAPREHRPRRRRGRRRELGQSTCLRSASRAQARNPCIISTSHLTVKSFLLSVHVSLSQPCLASRHATKRHISPRHRVAPQSTAAASGLPPRECPARTPARPR